MRTARLFLMWVLVAAFSCAHAQKYPERSIRVVVSFPPGGSTDFIARILQQHLPATLGQAIVIDNRGGAGGMVGSDIIAKAAPDGYSLLITAEPPITIHPSVYAKMPYDPVRDIPAITQLINYPLLAVVHPSVPVTSVKDLIQAAKAQPGKLRYAHPGVGTTPHLAAELFKMMAGVDTLGVPYKGGGPAMIALVGNETHLSFATPPSSLPYVKGGRLKAIAQTSAKRSAAMPDVPTIAESGVPRYEVEGWVGLFAPAGTPNRIVQRLYGEVAKVLRMPDVKELVLSAGGSEVSGLPTDETRAKVRAEIAMWAKVVKSTGIKVE